MLKAKSIDVVLGDFIVAITFFLSTSSIVVMTVSFVFRDCSISSRKDWVFFDGVTCCGIAFSLFCSAVVLFCCEGLGSFSFSKMSSIFGVFFAYDVLGVVFFDSSLICFISSFFTSQAFGTSVLAASSWLLVFGSSSFGASFFGSSFLGKSILSTSSWVENAYFQVILSWNLKGIAKSFMFRRATLILGSSSSSVIIIFSFNFS